MSLALAMSAFLLELHEKSNELGYRALHRFTLERLAALLPFDAGLLATGTVQKGDPQSHDFVLDRLSPELMAEAGVAEVVRPAPAREREIAAAFSPGETHREIGERLGLAANTVRRHLANIYDKLGIASKVELDRMLSGLM